MALVRRRQEQQCCHHVVLRFFFPSSCHLFWLAMIACLLIITTATTTTTSDGSNAIAHCSSSSRSSSSGSRGRCLLMPTFTARTKRDILGRRCVTSPSSLSSSCLDFIPSSLNSWQTTTSTTTTTTTAKKRAAMLLSIRGGGDAASIVVSGGTFKAIMTSIGESKTKCWILLIVCILAETWATSLSKTARDENSPGIFAASLVLYSACMLGFNVALSKIEVGIAYAVWSALGTLVVTYIGIVCFGESFDLYKLLCLALIFVGVIGLNIREDHQ